MSTTPTNNNNPLTEIGVILISVVLIAAATVLLILGKIDFTAATLMLGLVAAIFGVNGALKAASPAQQAQLHQLTSQVLSVLPTVVTASQSASTLSPSDIAAALVAQLPQLAIVTEQQPQPFVQPAQQAPSDAPYSTGGQVIPPRLSLPSTGPSTFPDSLSMPVVQPLPQQ